MKEYVREIKSLVDFYLEKCSIHPFPIGLGKFPNFPSRWKNVADSMFDQSAKKALSPFELGETSGLIPTIGTTSELYNDLLAFQNFYGI